jgi:hypothetical protein
MNLKKQLDSIMVLDQEYRQMLSGLTSKEKVDSVGKIYNIESSQVINHFAKIQTDIDSSNLHFIEDVIKKYGYPGKSIVGPETSETAWFILQHSNKIGQYLPLIKQAGQKGELKKTHVAMMEDRYLMYQGKEQLYGTQGAYKTLRDGTSQMIIYPIKDPKNVNKRRKKVGFDTSIEEYAKKMNINYRVIKLTDIKQ